MIEFRAASDGNDTTELLCYGDIGDSMWAEVGASEFAKQLQDVKTPKLRLRINSIGGSVFAGLAIYNSLKAWPGEIEVRIDGLAASIASVVAMAGKTIVMPANAMMMVHKPWCAVAGNSDDLRKTADTLDQLINSLASIYSARTKQTDAVVRQLMQDETWLDAESAKSLGFADEVVPDAVAAKLEGELFNVAGQVFQSAAVHQFAQILTRMCPPAVSGGLAHDIILEDKPMETKTDPIPVAQVDIDEMKAAARADEKTRVLTIQANAKKLGVADAVAQALIKDNVPLADARAKLIDAAAGAEVEISGMTHVSVGTEAVEHMARGIVGALMSRNNPAIPVEEVARPFMYDSLLGMGEQFLAGHGINIRGKAPLDKARAILSFRAAGLHTTSDFPGVLGATINKSLFKGYTEAPRNFLPFCRQRNPTDLKLVTTVGLGEFPTIEDVAENGEYKRVTIGERQESWLLSKAGHIFGITLESLINDDQNAFTVVPSRHGNACSRKQMDVVWALITGKAHMADGKDWCHADHNNMATGAVINPPDADTIAGMQQILRMQKGVDGVDVIGAYGRFLLLPTILAHGVRQLLGGNYMPVTTAQAVTEDQRSLVIIDEPRLDTASSTEWYLFASPNDIDTIEYGFLAGSEGPQLSRRDGFDTDSVEFKVSQFFGAHIMDYRGMAYNLGT